MACLTTACKNSKLVSDGNSENNNKRYDCLYIIKNLSYYWQIDSLANNGYRRMVRHHLQNCIVDSTHADTVKKYLGTPSKVTTYSYPNQFSYTYYYDSKNINQEKAPNFPGGFDGIILDFDSSSKKLIEVRHTTGEY